MEDFLQVSDLTISVENNGIRKPIVNQVSFTLRRGEVLALIGESGSGKTTVALSLLGYTKPGCQITGGEIRLGTDNLLQSPQKTIKRWRGQRIAYIAQSAAAAFNPAKKLIDQVIESAKRHQLGSRETLRHKAIELFRELALPEAETIGERYPHEVSGGQLQRVMAAMALLGDPELVILDEPTTALDVTTQVEVLQVFRRVVQQRQVTAVYVSHDLAVVAQVADQIVVLNQGCICEKNTTEAILNNAQDEYTQQLLSAVAPQPPIPLHLKTPDHEPLLVIRKLLAGYGRRDPRGLPAHKVLDDINLTLYPGNAIGIIGESGSGKSTLAKSLAGLLPPALGYMRFRGEVLSGNLSRRSRDQCRRIQLVFQHADTALNPKHTVRQLLARPLRAYFRMRRTQREARIYALLDLVQLPRDVIDRKPSALSGGQKQRVNLARALAAEPDLIICDEVTSALDTVVGAAILELLNQLKNRLGFAFVFISHDIHVVRALCDHVMVMYQGVQVQTTRTSQLEQGRLHPYTALLIDSIPQMRTNWILEPRLATEHGEARAGNNTGLLPDPEHPEICAFLSRCPKRMAGICERTAPNMRSYPGSGQILCHLSEQALPRGMADAPETVPLPYTAPHSITHTHQINRHKGKYA
jgi:peptide/nickel transport system ATP-binding protein